MYGALWRILPGPVWLRILILVLLLSLVLLSLLLWGFPWVNSLLPVTEVTVGE